MYECTTVTDVAILCVHVSAAEHQAEKLRGNVLHLYHNVMQTEYVHPNLKSSPFFPTGPSLTKLQEVVTTRLGMAWNDFCQVNNSCFQTDQGRRFADLKNMVLVS